MFDAIVIGAGQSGLAAARALLDHGLTPVVLEAGPEPVGSWPHYYDSLTLFSPAQYSALPGIAFPGDPDHYPHRDEVIDYLRHYAATLDADTRTGHRVEAVDHDGDAFTARTDTATTFTAPRLIAATGGFGTPHIPTLPGQDSFTGKLLHASRYRSPLEYTGQNVIVVGAGTTAVQIAAELADHATVTLATRTPVKFVPQRPLGKDLHFWFRITGFDALPLGRFVTNPPIQPVLDTGRYRAALTAENPRPDRCSCDSTATQPSGRTAHTPPQTRSSWLLATGQTCPTSQVSAHSPTPACPAIGTGCPSPTPAWATSAWNGSAPPHRTHCAASAATPNS
ncbi:flavin-containing monooxygenase [Nocardia amamiensis]|uniref:flavin-containing monooxygenase n=1 Tax=Nocardia amamiensis TaxID=404578 RepID=UPI001E5E35F5|nr:NAD(P)-binding domain-containing protein [Nocardia amamiensis]